MSKRRAPLLEGEYVSGEAARIIALFGGPLKLLEALASVGVNLDRLTPYRWTYAASRQGTGGYIPNKRRKQVQAAARAWGVILPSDFHV